MNTAKACIQHRVATILAVIMVAIFGVMYGSQLQMALMPDIEMPMAVVMCVVVRVGDRGVYSIGARRGVVVVEAVSRRGHGEMPVRHALRAQDDI